MFLEDKSLALKGRKRITFNPFSQDEMPMKGGLVAIDAEFVTLNQEESELRSDGKVSTIKAAQMYVRQTMEIRLRVGRGVGPRLRELASRGQMYSQRAVFTQPLAPLSQPVLHNFTSSIPSMYCTRIYMYCVLSITGLLLVLLVFGEAVLMKDVSVLGCAICITRLLM